jgi:hypothetical protein
MTCEPVLRARTMPSEALSSGMSALSATLRLM